jgi:beta-lactamase superfamily II metal-dependent hydrolase
LPELLILDVGHGNCAVLNDTAGVIIIDCAPGTTLKETLEQLGITEISRLLISHADEDHVAGLIGVLQDPQISVKHVYINPDAMKTSDIWYDVRVALAEARKTKQTEVHPHLTMELTGSLDAGQVHVEVLAPSQELALSAVGGKDLKGRKITSNSMSAVIGLSHNGRRLALITGDLDGGGLENLLEDGADIKAEILVFPHHGGKPGAGDGEQFARDLCSRVEPSLVLFSMARSRTGFPRPEVVDGVMSTAPMAHVACTQLSLDCAADLPVGSKHLMNYPARGRQKNACCAGTIRFGIPDDASLEEFIIEHGTFVGTIAPTMCNRKS